jgi:hypothetical protein
MIIPIGTRKFVLEKIFAIERGTWHDEYGDWDAVIVSTDGTRIETSILCQYVEQMLEFAWKEKNNE